MTEKDHTRVSRLTACKAEANYQLWLRFEDGLEGCVSLENLLSIGAFRRWQYADEFSKVAVDEETDTVRWQGGICLDTQVLYRDLVALKHSAQLSSLVV